MIHEMRISNRGKPFISLYTWNPKRSTWHISKNVSAFWTPNL